MRIARIDQLLTLCQEHLGSTDSYRTDIETLLAYALVVRMYAEFEREIKAAIADRGADITDLAQRATFDARINDHYRGIRVRSLSGLLASLGAPYRAGWDARQAVNPRAVTFYGFIVERRHDIAHSVETVANFRDVRAWYESGHIVLDFFRETLFAIDPA